MNDEREKEAQKITEIVKAIKDLGGIEETNFARYVFRFEIPKN